MNIFPEFTDSDAQRPVTVLSSGAGQESFALNLLAAFSGSFVKEFIGERDLIVVHSDTGDEHPETYAFIEHTLKPFCIKWNIPFYYLTHDLGYHTGHWAKGLRGQYRAHDTIGMMTTRSCTDSLKVSPIYKFLDEYLGRRYGYEWGRKKALRAYTERFGKLRVMIGFAKGEESRVAQAPVAEQTQLDLGKEHKAKKKQPPAWMRDCVERTYPLIDLSMDRAACQEYALSHSQPVPRPSNCMACHFKSPEEILHYSLTDPSGYADWVQLEANKIEKYKHLPVNNGVKGKKLLPQVVAEIYASLLPKFPNEQAMRDYLADFIQSHGHCVTTTY